MPSTHLTPSFTLAGFIVCQVGRSRWSHYITANSKIVEFKDTIEVLRKIFKTETGIFHQILLFNKLRIEIQHIQEKVHQLYWDSSMKCHEWHTTR